MNLPYQVAAVYRAGNKMMQGSIRPRFGILPSVKGHAGQGSHRPSICVNDGVKHFEMTCGAGCCDYRTQFCLNDHCHDFKDPGLDSGDSFCLKSKDGNNVCITTP
jgi:hypothetical protein